MTPEGWPEGRNVRARGNAGAHSCALTGHDHAVRSSHLVRPDTVNVRTSFVDVDDRKGGGRRRGRHRQSHREPNFSQTSGPQANRGTSAAAHGVDGLDQGFNGRERLADERNVGSPSCRAAGGQTKEIVRRQPVGTTTGRAWAVRTVPNEGASSCPSTMKC
jgi:hypothetical protein